MYKGSKGSTSTIHHYDLGSSLKYPHRLNFYDRPPLDDVTIEEFEICAIDRLRILAEIEACGVRNRSWEETKAVIDAQCVKYLNLGANTRQYGDSSAERRKDHLGHFVLRLAFCRSEELRRRFVKAELSLFKARYETDDTMERQAFLSSRNFDWTMVGDEEKGKIEKELLAAQGLKSATPEFKGEKYCKVRWTRVPDLVARRKVFLKGGWAYVPGREQSSIVFQEYEENLTKALEITAKSLPRLDEDTRIVPILSNLSQGFLMGIPSSWAGAEGDTAEIKAGQVDDLARNHFPPCIRNIHDALRKDRHLKHFGRLSYTLFLKVLGLSIEEAMIFWQKSYADQTKFEKEYKYNIRHSYGLEGKRANYPAKSCGQFLTGGEGGCPYKSYSPENLQTALISSYSQHGLSSSDLPEIMHLVKGNHYQVACTRVFEMTHSRHVKKGDGIGGEHVSHPNQYAAKSIEFEKGEKEDEMVVE